VGAASSRDMAFFMISLKTVLSRQDAAPTIKRIENQHFSLHPSGMMSLNFVIWHCGPALFVPALTKKKKLDKC